MYIPPQTLDRFYRNLAFSNLFHTTEVKLAVLSFLQGNRGKYPASGDSDRPQAGEHFKLYRRIIDFGQCAANQTGADGKSGIYRTCVIVIGLFVNLYIAEVKSFLLDL